MEGHCRTILTASLTLIIIKRSHSLILSLPPPPCPVLVPVVDDPWPADNAGLSPQTRISAVLQGSLKCRQHGQEYAISVREYKGFAETSKHLAPSATMSLFAVKTLQNRAEVEEKIGSISPYIASLQAEIDGRITHQRRFFNDNADEGHQGRIDRQQNKLDTARTLQERLGERLEELKAEDRQRELQKQARPDRGLTPRAFSDEISGCSCPTCSGERNRYGHSNTEFPTLPRCAKLASGKISVPPEKNPPPLATIGMTHFILLIGGPLRASRQKAQYSEVARPRSQGNSDLRFILRSA
ncbi:hypothetical protein QCA50_019558 [Cerrena zonata]|uniref:Uncharacterized protein n=1 Tax=Cerrena zonata TaxID=2478898 RepID=A0AAW0F8W7_9APHY